jgi:hypothetical protein
VQVCLPQVAIPGSDHLLVQAADSHAAVALVLTVIHSDRNGTTGTEDVECEYAGEYQRSQSHQQLVLCQKGTEHAMIVHCNVRQCEYHCNDLQPSALANYSTLCMCIYVYIPVQ